MPLNRKLLRKVRNRIAEIPESYDQSRYHVETSVSPCGYAACLAGETIICNAPNVKSGIQSLICSTSIAGRARRLLGLGYESDVVIMAHNDDEREPCPTEGCDNEAAEDGDRCAECEEVADYWRRQWERYGQREVANRPTVEDVNSCYSEPCESAKRAGMLAMIEREVL